MRALLLGSLMRERHPTRIRLVPRLTGRPVAASIMAACLLTVPITVAWAGGGGIAVAATVPAAGAETEPLSLDEAVRLAVDSSPEMELARLRLAQADLAFDQADNIAGSVKERDATTWDLRLAREYNPVAARNALEYAEKDLSLVERRVRLSVSGAYYEALKAESMLSAARAGRERAEKHLERARLLYEAGKAARVDVLAAETGVAAARTAIVSSEKAVQMAHMALNRAIGLAPGDRRSLSSRGPDTDDSATGTSLRSTVTSDAVDIGGLVAAALPERLDVSTASVAAEQARLYLEMASGFYTANVWTVRQAAISVQSADIALKQAKSRAELEIRLSHLSLLEAAERYDMTAGTVENAAEGVRISGIRHDAGAGTAFECVAAEAVYRQAQAEHIQAGYDFSLAVARFDFIREGGQF